MGTVRNLPKNVGVNIKFDDGTTYYVAAWKLAGERYEDGERVKCRVTRRVIVEHKTRCEEILERGDDKTGQLRESDLGDAIALLQNAQQFLVKEEQ